MRRRIAAVGILLVLDVSVFACKGRRAVPEIEREEAPVPTMAAWRPSGPIPSTTIAPFIAVELDDGKFPIVLRAPKIDPIAPRPPMGELIKTFMQLPDLLGGGAKYRSPAGVDLRITNWSDGTCAAVMQKDGVFTRLPEQTQTCAIDFTSRYLALSQAARDADGKVVWTDRILDVDARAETILPASTCGGDVRWAGERLLESARDPGPMGDVPTPVCVFDHGGRLLARLDVRVGWRKQDGLESINAQLGFLGQDADVLYVLDWGDEARPCQLHLLDLRDGKRRKTWQVGPLPGGCEGRHFGYEADGTFVSPELRYTDDHFAPITWKSIHEPDSLASLP